MMMDGSGPTLPPGFINTNGLTPITNSWAWASGFDHGTNLCFWSIGYVVTNQTTNLYLTIANTQATNSYDLYVSTNLTSVPFWDGVTQGIVWSFLTNLSAGVTNLTLSNVTETVSFYAMALHQDSDGDGLSDGDEFFLYKTDLNNADTDDDGSSDAEELLHGTNPLDPASVQTNRLGYWSFNGTNWLGEQGQQPLTASNVLHVPAWITDGLKVDATNAAILRYRYLETNGTANINCRNGSVRFWFKPDWNSNTNLGSEGSLIEIGAKGTASGTNGWWALYLDAYRTNLLFRTETNGAGQTYFTNSVNWSKWDWTQIVLNYTPTNTALYTNGVLAATNIGVAYYPARDIRTNGFTIGSNRDGTNQARGLFEDLETFNYSLTTNEITANYQSNYPPSHIPGLKMWLLPDLGIETNDAAGRVRYWRDQSGSTNDASQTSGYYQPFWFSNVLNKHAVLRFDTDRELSLKPFLTNASEAEAFITLRVQTETPTGDRGLWMLGSGSTGKYPDTQGQVHDDFGKSLKTEIGSFPRSLTNIHIFDVTSASGRWSARINGILKMVLTTNLVTFSSTPALGRGGNRFDGDIAEVLIYDRVLTEAQRNHVASYLSEKFNVVQAPPPVPTNFAAAPLSPTQVSLWWKSEFETTRTAFHIERQAEGEDKFNEVAVVEDGWSFIDSNLAPSNHYYYRARAANYAGPSDYSGIVEVATPVTGANMPLDMQLWLKADTGTPRNRDNTLEMWFDLTSNENHLTKYPTSPLLTNAMNGRPTVQFSSALGRFRPPKTLFDAFSEAEVFLALKARSNTPTNDASLWRFGSNVLSRYPSPAGELWDTFGSVYRYLVVSNSPVITNYHLFNVSSATGPWAARINLVQEVSVTTNVVGFPKIPELGLGDGATFYGEMVELLLFKRVLGTAERSAIQTYLNSKYNLWTP